MTPIKCTQQQHNVVQILADFIGSTFDGAKLVLSASAEPDGVISVTFEPSAFQSEGIIEAEIGKTGLLRMLQYTVGESRSYNIDAILDCTERQKIRPKKVK